MGVEISDKDTKEDLLKKEREYSEHRHTIEIVLESFYRSANSLVFQLNKRYIPKHKSILRVIGAIIYISFKLGKEKGTMLASERAVDIMIAMGYHLVVLLDIIFYLADII